MTIARLVPSLAGLLIAWGSTLAAEPPSYTKQVKPFLTQYCVSCHKSTKTDGGLNLETYQGFMEGGISGPSLVPGKPDESWLVTLSEGKQQPIMPPKSALRQPKPEDAAILRTWVAAGAPDDTSGAVVIPSIKPKTNSPAPVTALAYSRDGKVLAIGGHHEVTLLDVESNSILGKLPGQAAKVTALAYSRSGSRLAVASGEPGSVGQVRVYFIPSSGLPTGKPEVFIRAHKDLIHDLAFNPDGQILATCSYDRLVKLWNVADGKELNTLKDHSDAVYGLSFSPDGKLLASAAADRAVKVWEVETGKRLYTLSEPTEWVYAVAWHPGGKHLAAAGVDKSIRVWEVSADGGKLIHSVFAHEGPVTRLVYSVDGKTLYSLSEDRTVKSWDSAKMMGKKVSAKQPDAVLALSVRHPQGAAKGQLALGRYDGTVAVLDESTAEVIAQVWPIKPKPPQVTKLAPSFGKRGEVVRVAFAGRGLGSDLEVVATSPQGQSLKDFSAKVIKSNQGNFEAEVRFPPLAPAGVYQLSLKNAAGQSTPMPFTVDLFAATAENEPNDSPRAGQLVNLPVTLSGALNKPGDVDLYRFEAKAGQEIGVQVIASGPTKPEPILTLKDADGQILAQSGDGILGHRIEKAGIYAIGIRDREYRGEAAMAYRLHVGDIPIITSIFPLGLQRGTEANIHVTGVNLGLTGPVRIKAPADAAIGSKLPVPVSTAKGAPLGARTVVVGEFPEVLPPEKEQPASTLPIEGQVPIPGTANGELVLPGHTQSWKFAAKKGERLILEVNARRLGSPLDSVLEVLDAKGQPVPRATLRCLAKTNTTFRDHDSAGASVRIESWSELGINDFIYVGNELLRIKALPPHPDADCVFFSAGGQRTGWLDTTPTFLSQGTAMYKVEILPPATTFPPKGMPVFNLRYYNDDGGPSYGKDSRLFFDPPADGEYLVRIGNTGAQAHGLQSLGLPYRLTIRPPRPSFNVTFNPTTPSVWKGGAIPVSVTAERIDGFDDPIELRLENLPPGFSAPPTTIPEGENTTAFALFAEPSASPPAGAVPCKLVARAVINGKEVKREAAGGVPKLIDPGDIVTTTKQSEITVRPGSEVRLTVTIERRNDFKGRVPLEVRGLPHGVRVLDIGLNGILITERETTRTIAIYCEPWVEPIDHPIVVLAKREGKNTEHAAKSVMLKIAAPDPK